MQGIPTRLLKIDDVCDRLNIGRTTVWRFVKAGRLPEPMTIKGMKGARWTDEDVNKFLADTLAEHRGEAA